MFFVWPCWYKPRRTQSSTERTLEKVIMWEHLHTFLEVVYFSTLFQIFHLNMLTLTLTTFYAVNINQFLCVWKLKAIYISKTPALQDESEVLAESPRRLTWKRAPISQTFVGAPHHSAITPSAECSVLLVKNCAGVLLPAFLLLNLGPKFLSFWPSGLLI